MLHQGLSKKIYLRSVSKTVEEEWRHRTVDPHGAVITGWKCASESVRRGEHVMALEVVSSNVRDIHT